MKKTLGIFASILLFQAGYSQQAFNNKNKPIMKVEIWSDVMCPFCYIGKRKFEAALAQFTEKENIEIEWKSFQLEPNLKTDTTQSTISHLSESKGWSLEYTRQAILNVSAMAKAVGLHYDFDRAVVANSFDAHRLSHYAKTKGKGNELEEELFKAYFINGKNIADYNTLAELAALCGLNKNEAQQVLNNGSYSEDVKIDIAEAQSLGISGVPYFVFNRKYAVSGAQETNTFLQTLQQAYTEFKTEKNKNPFKVIDGASCKPTGECK